jgi:hypothetical protein
MELTIQFESKFNKVFSLVFLSQKGDFFIAKNQDSTKMCAWIGMDCYFTYLQYICTSWVVIYLDF